MYYRLVADQMGIELEDPTSVLGDASKARTLLGAAGMQRNIIWKNPYVWLSCTTPFKMVGAGILVVRHRNVHVLARTSFLTSSGSEVDLSFWNTVRS